MSDDIALVVTFGSDEECVRGIEALHEADVHSFRSFSPFPSEKIREAVDEARGWGRSPVRLWVLAGGIIGAITGFVLTIGTSWEWNLMTGGKPIASIPPFIIIAFELMILTGGIFAVTGFFFHGGLPVFDPEPGFRPRFGADRFGLVLHCAESDVGKLESLMRDAGAEEITREAA